MKLALIAAALLLSGTASAKTYQVTINGTVSYGYDSFFGEDNLAGKAYSSVYTLPDLDTYGSGDDVTWYEAYVDDTTPGLNATLTIDGRTEKLDIYFLTYAKDPSEIWLYAALYGGTQYSQLFTNNYSGIDLLEDASPAANFTYTVRPHETLEAKLTGEYNPALWFHPVTVSQTLVGSVPEPSSWAMMIVGISFVGGVSRAKRARLQDRIA